MPSRIEMPRARISICFGVFVIWCSLRNGVEIYLGERVDTMLIGAAAARK